MRVAISCFVFLLLTTGVVATDGPYVLRDAAGGWKSHSFEGSDGQEIKRVEALAPGASITVNAVGAVPGFKVKLRSAAEPPPEQIRVDAAAPLFVVADTHGEYEILVAMLQNHGVLGKRLEWKFGRGHLVLLGDVFDRGPNHTEILWLIYQLEAAAQRAGGGVHLLLGNHETMVLMGDLRYLNPRYLRSAELSGGSYAELFDAGSVLGQWLRTRPTIFRINDLLFLHAGISRALLDSGMSLAAINAGVSTALNAGARSELLLGSLGPLWYRGYFAAQTDFPTATMQDVDLTLQRFGAARILVGHTIVPTVTSLYQGKIIAVNVYPKRDELGGVQFEGVYFKRGEFRRATFDGRLERVLP